MFVRLIFNVGFAVDFQSVKFNIMIYVIFSVSASMFSRQQVLISAILKHSNLSMAEGYNVSCQFYLSKYLSFASLKSTNYTGAWPTVANLTSTPNTAVSIYVSIKGVRTDMLQV